MTCHVNTLTDNFTKYTDSEYINGLKSNNMRIINAFFYNHCRYMLDDLRTTMLKGVYDYDEMVSEMYLYLTEDNCRRLDTFNGKNGCSLKSWMVRVSWNYFNRRRQELLGQNVADSDKLDIRGLIDNADECARAEIRVDVQKTLESMPNSQYSKVLRLLLIEGYEPDEVAQMLNTNTKNVYNVKHRAVLQFIKVYNGDKF